MLEALIIAAAGFTAPECEVRFQRVEQVRLILGLRPDCPIGSASTRAAVRAILAEAGAEKEITLAMGRLVQYPWLSSLVARQASSSRVWDPVAGKARGGDNPHVAAALRGMPEFTVLFDDWQILGVSVEKVLVKRADELSLAQGHPLPPESLLPYDAIVWVTLRRP